jgi:Protein of unknown function (DUF1826)
MKLTILIRPFEIKSHFLSTATAAMKAVARYVSLVAFINTLFQLQFSRCLSSTAMKIRPSEMKNWINGNVRVLRPSIEQSRQPNPFEVLIPFMGKGCDVTVEWEDPHTGATKLADKCFNGKETDHVIAILEEALGGFRNLTIQEGVPATSFKARIVATRGPIGTKCPRWHYDHVVMRHIQALVGPGCDYVISDTGVDRSVVNQADQCETALINTDIVDDAIADVLHGREGEAIVLKGLAGCDRPAIHKSPELQWWQGRLLMTLDIK